MLTTKKINGQNRLPEIFNDFFEGNILNRINSNSPAMNVMEDDNNYFLEIAAPGMCKDDFSIHISKDGNLVVEMEKKCENKEECSKNGRYLRKEFSYSKFHQTLILPENAEIENIEACVKNGILFVNIPKMQNTKAEMKKRIIDVK